MTQPTEVREIARSLTKAVLQQPGLRRSAEQRFWRLVTRGIDGECWQWLGKPSSRGYGRLCTSASSSTPAHKVSYVLHYGTVPDGMVIDHTCRNRLCVNPLHLRAVTPKQNILENSNSVGARNAVKTHCPQGHEYSKENVYIRNGGGRNCRLCHVVINERYRQRKRQQSQFLIGEQGDD